MLSPPSEVPPRHHLRSFWDLIDRKKTETIPLKSTRGSNLSFHLFQFRVSCANHLWNWGCLKVWCSGASVERVRNSGGCVSICQTLTPVTPQLLLNSYKDSKLSDSFVLPLKLGKAFLALFFGQIFDRFYPTVCCQRQKPKNLMKIVRFKWNEPAFGSREPSTRYSTRTGLGYRDLQYRDVDVLVICLVFRRQDIDVCFNKDFGFD